MKYKYLIWNESTDDTDEVIIEAPSDERAKYVAMADKMIQINDQGEPYLYRENEPFSRKDCGINTCIVCNEWLEIGILGTHHGARLVCG